MPPHCQPRTYLRRPRAPTVAGAPPGLTSARRPLARGLTLAVPVPIRRLVARDECDQFDHGTKPVIFPRPSTPSAAFTSGSGVNIAGSDGRRSRPSVAVTAAAWGVANDYAQHFLGDNLMLTPLVPGPPSHALTSHASRLTAPPARASGLVRPRRTFPLDSQHFQEHDLVVVRYYQYMYPPCSAVPVIKPRTPDPYGSYP